MLRFRLAVAAGSALTWGLREVAHRGAGNMPGKVALRVDPALIGHLRPRFKRGVIVVTGTNGKTTVTNLVAAAIEASGQDVGCNRDGANLESGVATGMLQSHGADWGVFESDELWLTKILPRLQPDYVVLLNLFRDQLDRMGEIDIIQGRIVEALSSSPQTTLVYTADDPQCAAVADSVENPRIALGVDDDLGLKVIGVDDAQTCWRCGLPLTYATRQYDHLGDYRCEGCGLARPKPNFAARSVSCDASGLRFAIASRGKVLAEVSYAQGAPYLVYNLLSAWAVSRVAGVSSEEFQHAVDAFSPGKGRLQRFSVGGRPVMLNLAKNPTGFNESLRFALAKDAPMALALFVNDREADGRDVSWLWDVDFEMLAPRASEGMPVFAGGTRRNDLQVRLKYADVSSLLVEDVREVFYALRDSALPPSAGVFVLANYTALPDLISALDALAGDRT